jgi:hypothetical protein
MIENNEEIVIFQAPVIELPECRVYYDDTGSVLFYTCEKPIGNYLVIDNQTFAEGRSDLFVKNGKLVKKTATTNIGKLKPSKKGKKCHKEDVSVVSNTEDTDNNISWKYDNNE